ncbi:MAG TPA: ROK family transcriptional regulator [Acetivibrio sp.]|uniref:ROK family transcriptional regulator n=1 Tax=Acetivibrio sp. TaxID=1872092 RepID=UPI002CBAF7B6|nr:ROK family transcriptional regulator [Acetivibrio sp.]HOM02040.1 ROK family transcriptional regulator [Acetivibrio sp.]
MSKFTKLDLNSITNNNRMNVFNCILEAKKINRAVIAKKVGLSIPAVMSITDELIQRGIIYAVGKGESSGGKRPELLAVVPDRFFFIGVDIGRTSVRVVVMNNCRDIIYKMSKPTESVEPYELIGQITEMTMDSIKESKLPLDRVVGIGIAMPGLIERDTGRVLFSPNFGWNDIPLQDELKKRLPFNVLVENANRALVIGEIKNMQPNPTSCIIGVNLAYGIGSAIVLPNGLYYGVSGTSGEIGHIIVENHGSYCSCGNYGCIESIASGEAIARQARIAIANKIQTSIAEKCEGDLKKIDAKMVFDAAKEGDHLAESIVKKSADYIGKGLAVAINMLDPEQIILCGGLTLNGDFFIDMIKKAVSKYQMRYAGGNVKIVVGKSGHYATAIGGAWIVVNNIDFLSNN